MSLKKKQQKETASPPVAKIRVGLVTASIWDNSNENGTFYGVTFERRYKDGEGNWKSSNSYDSHSLPQLVKAADLAHTKILEAMAEDTEE